MKKVKDNFIQAELDLNIKNSQKIIRNFNFNYKMLKDFIINKYKTSKCQKEDHGQKRKTEL